MKTELIKSRFPNSILVISKPNFFERLFGMQPTVERYRRNTNGNWVNHRNVVVDVKAQARLKKFYEAQTKNER